MSTPTSGDLLLVSRDGVNYQIDYEDMSTLQDTDLLLVSRGGVNYHIAAADLNLGPQGSIGNPVEVLTPPDGAGVGGDLTYYPKTDIASSVTTVLLAGQTTIPGGILNFSGVTYGDGKYVAVCSNSTTGSYVYHSTDGVNWTAATSPLNIEWKDVAFGNGTFVAVGPNSDGSQIMYSSDGETWTGTQTANAISFYGVTFAAELGTSGRFIGVGINGNGNAVSIAYSDDNGVTWTTKNSPSTSYQFSSVAYSPDVDRVVAVGYNPTPFIYSDDGGASWTGGYGGDGVDWRSIRYFPEVGYFIAVGDNGYIGTSPDGVTWNSNVRVDSAWDFYDVASDGTNTIAIASNGLTAINTSYSSNSWSVGSDLSYNYITMTYGGGKFIVMGNIATVSFSEDGLNWDASKEQIILTGTNIYDSSNDQQVGDVTPAEVLLEGDAVTGAGTAPDVLAQANQPYQGNASTLKVTNGLDLERQGGFVWLKRYDGTANAYLYATDLGFSYLQPDRTDTLSSTSSSNGISEWNTDGFTFGGNHGGENTTGVSYASWGFVKSPGFVDTQLWVNNGGNTQAINHDLDATPGFIMIKDTQGTADWYCWHSAMPTGQFIKLNGLSSRTNNSNTFPTLPTDTVFYPGDQTVNGGFEAITVLFAEDTPGVIKCSSYIGDGTSSRGITGLGFEPGWLLIKNISNNTAWELFDTNTTYAFYPATNNESSIGLKSHVTFTSDGFNISNTDENTNNNTYVYVAIAAGALSEGALPTGVLKSDAIGNVIDLVNTVGTWKAGMSVVKDSTVTEFAPSPLDVTFTSMNAGTTPFTGTEATLAFRKWTLETRATADDPWTVVDTYEDYDPVGSQDGATPWTTNKPTLAANTMYRVKVQYNSANADPVESVYSTFTTGNF